MISIAENPFRVHTPEALSADEVVRLYVTEMPGADAVHGQGHSMIVGSRGSGKSMMLRFLEPDCQMLKDDLNKDLTKGYQDAQFFSLYVTIKQTDLIYPELDSLRGTFADRSVNEHFLILVLVLKAVSRCLGLGTLEFLKRSQETVVETELFNFIDNTIGWENDKPSSCFEMFEHFSRHLSEIYSDSLQYLDAILENPTETPKFKRPLLRFSTFLLPLLDAWRKLEGMPKSELMFVIIDDADYLNEMQTKILNTYISTRQASVFFKVASEVFQYKSYNTLDGRRIEVPHDFSEINTIDIYTSNSTRGYEERLTKIIDKRLQLFNHTSSKTGRMANADQFFPEDAKQKAEIARIRRDLSKGITDLESGAARKRDDAYRYAVPEYIRQLGGPRKSRSNYSYSGYKQLVNISSGVPRYFLEAAYIMYDRMKATEGSEFKFISPSVQNTVLREQADRIMMDELERLKLSDTDSDGSSDAAVMLHNLIVALGSMFQKSLVDVGASERRYFSFALSENPTDLVSKVLRFGVRNSMFTRTTIGRKEGFGRTYRYILTRRIAPYFTLDPNGFSGYQFLTNNALQQMMTNPEAFRKGLRRGVDISASDGPLFDGVDQE